MITPEEEKHLDMMIKIIDDKYTSDSWEKMSGQGSGLDIPETRLHFLERTIDGMAFTQEQVNHQETVKAFNSSYDITLDRTIELLKHHLALEKMQL